MEILQQMLVNKYHLYFPEEVKTVKSDDQPFYTNKLDKMKRKKAREYNKHRKSSRWEVMNIHYEAELSKAKMDFYNKKIKNLGKANPANWYREFKKLTSFDQLKSDEIEVEEIKDLANIDQAELIAEKFAAISQEFDKLKDGDISVPEFSVDDIPVVSVGEVEKTLAQMNSNKSSVQGDVPAKLLKHFAKQLAEPVAQVFNASVKQGCWPEIFKLEIVTPVPKVFPPKSIDELRNISGLLNIDKVA